MDHMSSSTPSTTSSQVPDDRGRYGDFGGRFVPETLTRALDQLAEQYYGGLQRHGVSDGVGTIYCGIMSGGRRPCTSLNG